MTRGPVQVAVLVGVFAAVTLLALAVGAANLGTAAAFGAMAFAATLVWLLLER